MNKNRGMHFQHLNLNSLLPIIKEICHLAQLTNASVKGTSETKLGESVLNGEIVVEGYDLIKLGHSRN